MQTGLLPLPMLVPAVAASILPPPGFSQLSPAKEVSIVEIFTQLQTRIPAVEATGNAAATTSMAEGGGYTTQVPGQMAFPLTSGYQQPPGVGDFWETLPPPPTPEVFKDNSSSSFS